MLTNKQIDNMIDYYSVSEPQERGTIDALLELKQNRINIRYIVEFLKEIKKTTSIVWPIETLKQYHKIIEAQIGLIVKFDGENETTINRITAAASNLLAKHKLGAVSEADVRWMETELKDVKPCMPS